MKIFEKLISKLQKWMASKVDHLLWGSLVYHNH